ncbi:MAG: phosphatase PAP2 family protein [Patescibacteria group bacterium]|nr:phosphatase PAP2 family protein [Patescibacteria group bacterium]
MKHRLFTFSLFFTYITVMTILMISQGQGFAPARYILVLLLGSLLVKRARNFVLDWSPFLFILISYDFLRVFVKSLILDVSYFQIPLDQKFFGFIPTVTLQQRFFNPESPSWYDFLGTLLYFLHFALPVCFAFLLWTDNKKHFREFVTGISLLSYAAWITYMIFPTAPPWMAAENGYLPGVHKVMSTTLGVFAHKIDLATVYQNLNPNPIAAFPSMHASYPFLVFLFAWRFFKTKALLFFPYVLAVWLAVIYMGEHYFVDVVSGITYTLFFYLLSTEVLHRINWQKLQKKILGKYFAKACES